MSGWWMVDQPWLAPSVLALAGVLVAPAHAMSGAITIAGNGPEQVVIEQLAHAYERSHLGAVIDLRWDPSFHPAEMVKSGEADFAVADQTDADLVAIPIAWDGIAVMVDFTNPVKEVTSQQVADMFSGAVTRWSALGGSDTPILLFDRPAGQHIRAAFESLIGIVGKIPPSAELRRSDQRAISSVAGNASAATYVSLRAALEAVTYGVGVALLVIDGVEPATETVKDGRYHLRRPVLLLRKQVYAPAAAAFSDFVRSKEGQNIIDETFVTYGHPDK